MRSDVSHVTVNGQFQKSKRTCFISLLILLFDKAPSSTGDARAVSADCSSAHAAPPSSSTLRMVRVSNREYVSIQAQSDS
jgi:hypothetical protein